jgi:hypothetical protein
MSACDPKRMAPAKALLMLFSNLLFCNAEWRRLRLGGVTMFGSAGAIVIVIVGAGIAGVSVLASGVQSWWPAVIIFLLTLCVLLIAQPQDD